MSRADIPWRRATRHNFCVGQNAVEVAYTRGVALVAYRAAVGPLCMALNRTFTGETIEDAKRQAEDHVQAASPDALDDWHIPRHVFRAAYGLAK